MKMTMNMEAFQALENRELMDVEGGLLGFVSTLPTPTNFGALLLNLFLSRLS